jgi:hypothetical protein
VFHTLKHNHRLRIQLNISHCGGESPLTQFERDRLDVGGEQLPVVSVRMYLGMSLDEPGRFETIEPAIHCRSRAITQLDEFPGWPGLVTNGVQDRSDVRIVKQLEYDLRGGRRFCSAVSSARSR